MFDSIRQQFEHLADRVSGAVVGASVGSDVLEELKDVASQYEMVKENLADLSLSADDIGWGQINTDFANRLIQKGNLDRVVHLSRIMYLLNPLIRRAVTVQELYVWGSGVSIRGEDTSPEIQQVLDDFFADPKNQCAIGDAWAEREREQRNDGNTFFIFFINKSNGAARCRTVSVDEVQDVICNPEDRNEPWFYVRTTADGKTVVHPDINYNPVHKPTQVQGIPATVDWNTRLLHCKTGGLPGMKLGIPELYSVFNWATAYKGILENFATILKAYAKIAWKLTGQKSAKGVAAAKAKLNTSMTSDDAVERNPATNTASYAIMAGNADLSAVKTSNSTTGPDEARALRSMVASGSDTPEHFFGDSDIGNFATSTTLDRPTELKMIARQQMWASVIMTMATNLVIWSARAPRGVLNRAGYKVDKSRSQFDGSQSVKITAPADKSTKITVKFPTILERNVTDRVSAVVKAATLGGRPAEGIIPDRKLLFKLLLEALGEKDADYLTSVYYKDSVMQGFKDPADGAKNDKTEADAKKVLADAAMLAAKQPAAKPAPKV